MIDRSVSIIIIGAGLTGLITANLLGQYGIDVLLVERNTGLSDMPRAISIDDEGLRICQAAGLRDEVLAHVLQDLEALYFSHGKLIGHAAPTSRRNGYPFISTFNQPRLEAVLLAGLQRFPHIEVLFEHIFETCVQTEQGVIISVRTPAGLVQQIACAYLLACDGGKSPIRHALGISMRGTTFAQRWLVVDANCEERSADRQITFFCDPVHPAVSVPGPDQHWRWEFMLHPGEREDDFNDHGRVRQLLLQIGDTREMDIIRHAIYTFHASYATSFSQGRVFLLGDAAHLLPPFGGQGMNCGLRDAYNLAWKLALVLHGQARSTILKTYQQERQPHVLQMIRFSSFLGNVIMPTNRLLAFLRDITLRTMMTLPPIASSFREMRIKPSSFYKRGFVLLNGHSLAGHLLPQPTVLLQGEQPVLLDELLSSGFTLLRLHSNPGEAFKSLQADLWSKLGLLYICLVPTIEDMQDKNVCPDVIYALDSQQQIANFLRSQRDHFVLIRPDRHILGTFRSDREQAFVSALCKHFFA